MPKNGLMGKPGLGVWLLGDGRGVMEIPPVSVNTYRHKDLCTHAMQYGG